MSAVADRLERSELTQYQPGLSRFERWLAVAAVGLFGIADVTISIWMMASYEHAYESTPLLAAWVGQAGLVALPAAKLLVLIAIGMCLLVVTGAARVVDISPRPFRAVLLAMVAGRGLLLVGWNLWVLWLILTHDVPPAVQPPF